MRKVALFALLAFALLFQPGLARAQGEDPYWGEKEGDEAFEEEFEEVFEEDLRRPRRVRKEFEPRFGIRLGGIYGYYDGEVEKEVGRIGNEIDLRDEADVDDDEFMPMGGVVIDVLPWLSLRADYFYAKFQGRHTLEPTEYIDFDGVLFENEKVKTKVEIHQGDFEFDFRPLHTEHVRLGPCLGFKYMSHRTRFRNPDTGKRAAHRLSATWLYIGVNLEIIPVKGFAIYGSAKGSPVAFGLGGVDEDYIYEEAFFDGEAGVRIGDEHVGLIVGYRFFAVDIEARDDDRNDHMVDFEVGGGFAQIYIKF
jgi:hypothetical protein